MVSIQQKQCPIQWETQNEIHVQRQDGHQDFVQIAMISVRQKQFELLIGLIDLQKEFELLVEVLVEPMIELIVR